MRAFLTTTSAKSIQTLSIRSSNVRFLDLESGIQFPIWLAERLASILSMKADLAAEEQGGEVSVPALESAPVRHN